MTVRARRRISIRSAASRRPSLARSEVPLPINKRQHVIPRAYLERFVEVAPTEGNTPALWVFERAEREPYRQAPKNAAVKPYYYTYFSKEGVREDAADELLQQVENLGLPVLRRLETGADPATLTDEEKAYAAHLIGTFAVRVEGFRTTVDKLAQEVLRRTAELSAAHKEYFEDTMRKASEAAGKPPPQDIEGVRRYVLSGEYDIQVDPLLSLQQMVQLGPVIAEYAYNFHWRVLEAPEGSVFVTSDHPLVLVSTQKQPAFYGLGAGWESPWMEATLPLSPRSLLLVSQHHPDGREVATLDAVHEANLRTAVFATRVFADRPIDVGSLNRPDNWDWWLPASNALVPRMRGEGAG